MTHWYTTVSNREELAPVVNAMGYPKKALIVKRTTPAKIDFFFQAEDGIRYLVDVAESFLSCSISYSSDGIVLRKKLGKLGMLLVPVAIVQGILRQLLWLKL